MSRSKYYTKIQELAKQPTFTAAQARALGVPSRMLAYFCKQGMIERIGRGRYRGFQPELDRDFEWEDLVIATISTPKGVICLISALCYYGMTDQIMREFWIAVPNSYHLKRRPGVRMIRMRNIQLGQTEVQIAGHAVKIFDRERTVVDAFRHLSREVAIKSLRAYLFPRDKFKPDLNKLMAYAKKLRVDIRPYIMALTT